MKPDQATPQQPAAPADGPRYARRITIPADTRTIHAADLDVPGGSVCGVLDGVRTRDGGMVNCERCKRKGK